MVAIPFSDRLLDALESAASIWKDVKMQAPTTQHDLVPLTKLWSQKTEEEMEDYQRAVAGQVCGPTNRGVHPLDIA